MDKVTKNSTIQQNGYGIIQKAVTQNPDIPPLTKLVYCILTTYSDKDNICYPGYNTIQHDTGLCRQTVCNSLKELIDKGIITKNKGFRYRNIYHLNDHLSSLPDRQLNDLSSLPDRQLKVEQSTTQTGSSLPDRLVAVYQIDKNNTNRTIPLEQEEEESNNIGNVITENIVFVPENSEVEIIHKKKSGKRKQKKPEQIALHNELKKIFKDWYEDKKELSYYWKGQDGKALDQLTNQLNFYIRDNGSGLTPHELLKITLDNLPAFYFKIVDMAVLNSKFTTIINQIKQSDPYAQLRNEHPNPPEGIFNINNQ